MTPVTLTPEASAFVCARGGAVTLRPSPRHGCCGGTVALPVADLGPPDDPSAFVWQQIEGVEVYASPRLGPGPFCIGLDALFGLKRLYVEASVEASAEASQPSAEASSPSGEASSPLIKGSAPSSKASEPSA